MIESILVIKLGYLKQRRKRNKELMALNVISIGSSSSGKSYLIQSEFSNIILDVGLSAKRIRAGLEFAYLRPENIDAILITHEHVDHVGAIRAVAKDCDNATVYASIGTVANCEKFKHVDPARLCYVKAGEKLEIGNIKVGIFRLSHDAAEPVGYFFTDGEDRLIVATDTGQVTPEIFEKMENSNMLLIEANYEEQLLMLGPYPYSVKRRILSDLGHLSNVSTAKAITELVQRNSSESEVPLRIMLGHISSNNNSPLQASMTVISELEQAGFEKGREYILTVASKDELVVME